MRLLLFLPALLFLTTTATSNLNPVLTSSFTWNPKCGPSVACGPSAAGHHGIGFAASNNLTYAGCDNLGGNTVNCKASKIVSGVGTGCGQCWHITPQSDSYPSNGRSVGTSVVVKINDQCTDAGYCDQTESHPVNTGYGKEVHIDLCAESGVTEQFFGAVGPGVVTGLAQLLPDCSALEDGPYGSKLGNLESPSSSASTSSGSGSTLDSGGGGSSSSSQETVGGSSSSSGSGGSTSESSGGSSSSSSSSETVGGSIRDGNWTLSGIWMGDKKLSSGHDGQKAQAQAQAVGGASNGGESNNGGEPSSSSSSSSSSSVPPLPPPTPTPTPTTLVAIVSSSTTTPTASSVTGEATNVQGEDEEDEEDCEDEDEELDEL